MRTVTTHSPHALTYAERLALALVPVTRVVRSLLSAAGRPLRGRARVEAERHNRRVATRRWWLGSAERRAELVRKVGGTAALARWERRAERLARMAGVGEDKVQPGAEADASLPASVSAKFVPEATVFEPQPEGFAPDPATFEPERVTFTPQSVSFVPERSRLAAGDFEAYLDAVEAGVEAALAADDPEALELAIARLEAADAEANRRAGIAGWGGDEDIDGDIQPAVRFRLAGLPRPASMRSGKSRVRKAKVKEAVRDIWVSVWPSELREDEAEAAHRERRGQIVSSLLAAGTRFPIWTSQALGRLTNLPRPDI